MKKIYIDVTNIPELEHFTGVSRVVTEVLIRLVHAGSDVSAVSYSVEKHGYILLDTKAFVSRLEGGETENEIYTENIITPDEFEHGSVFFDVNSSWHTLPNRSFLLPKLKNRSVRLITLIHDIIPVRFPQFMAPHTLLKFMEFIVAEMTYADDIVVTTEAVKNDLTALFDELEMRRKPVHVIPLGADFTSDGKTEENSADEDIITKLSGRRFLLTVSTIEPRKNHKVIVDAYMKKIASLDTDIVFVGHIGWESEELMERMRLDSRFGNGIYVLEGVNDATLAKLYSMAYMVVFPSYAEGYGLSTIEAMIKGVPVICSDLPVMREVGGRFCDYFPADDPDALADIVESYVSSEDKYKEKKALLADEYVPPVWDRTVRSISELIETGNASADVFVHKPVKQIVYLSARPAPLLATLPYVEEFMPFITELVVFCPDKMADYMKLNYKGRLKLTTVTDDELLDGAALPADHATRNFFLRCLAMRRDILDDEFIMTDDDYRPLGPVDETCFFRDGRYIGYYFSDLSTWRYRIAELFSYDYSMFRTLEFLKLNGFPTLQYSAHQMQIINRRWYCDMIDEFPQIKTLGYDEWSTYFNYIASRHSENYEPVPYVCLSWPNIGGEDLGVRQSDYIFENFYKENYYGRGLFRKYAEGFTCPEYIALESKEKKEMAGRIEDNHLAGRKFREDAASEYEEAEHMPPHIGLYCFGDASVPPVLGAPESFKLSSEYLNKINIGISRDTRCAENIMQLELTAEVKTDSGETIATARRTIVPRVEYTYISFSLKKRTYTESDTSTLNLTVRNTLSGVSTTKTIPVEII